LKESSIKSLTIQKPKNSFSQPTPMKFIVWKKYHLLSNLKNPPPKHFHFTRVKRIQIILKSHQQLFLEHKKELQCLIILKLLAFDQCVELAEV